MTRLRKHKLVVEVETTGRTGQRQAQDMVHEWLERNMPGDAGSNGFRFISIGVMTGKRINAQHSRPRECQAARDNAKRDCLYPNCKCPHKGMTDGKTEEGADD